LPIITTPSLVVRRLLCPSTLLLLEPLILGFLILCRLSLSRFVLSRLTDFAKWCTTGSRRDQGPTLHLWGGHRLTRRQKRQVTQSRLTGRGLFHAHAARSAILRIADKNCGKPDHDRAAMRRQIPDTGRWHGVDQHRNRPLGTDVRGAHTNAHVPDPRCGD